MNYGLDITRRTMGLSFELHHNDDFEIEVEIETNCCDCSSVKASLTLTPDEIVALMELLQKRMDA